MRGRTVSLKVRFQDFSTVTRSATLPVPTDMSRVVYSTAHALLRRLRASGAGGQQVRLLGVRLEGLIPAGEVAVQLELGAGDPAPGWREAQDAVDRAVARFGSMAVRPAALLQHPKRPISSHHEDESRGDLSSR